MTITTITTIILIFVSLVGVLGLGVAIWSFFDTRKKFYNEYLERKNKK